DSGDGPTTDLTKPMTLQRGGSALKRSARTKIRRNSSASADGRPNFSSPVDLRKQLTYRRVRAAAPAENDGTVEQSSVVEKPSAVSEAHSDVVGNQEETGAVKKPRPVTRFVSQLRDPMKPTITTYVEPRLLALQQKDSLGETEDSTVKEEDAPLRSASRV